MNRAKIWLILASFFFYAYWKLEYLPLLLFSVGTNFIIARLINHQRCLSFRNPLLVSGLTINLSFLFFFKYLNFILLTLGWLHVIPPKSFDIALPLAISFFTFTQIAYLVDVYRDKSIVYSFADYLFFVVFFPHLIAGPIVQHDEIIPQIRSWFQNLKFRQVFVGLILLTLGLIKKSCLADALAPHAQNVYDFAAHGGIVSMKDAWLGTLAFALQIYFDFSGYSDMAMGLALMFGIRFPANFNSPYQANSIIEFWSRWHMTLTRFLRIYVYFSLGGNRKGLFRQFFNILCTMLLSGLWHGAGWAFVIWGGLHGLYLIGAHAWRQITKNWGVMNGRVWEWFGRLLTFVLVLWSWVWFRAGHVQAAWKLTLSMVGLSHPIASQPPLIGLGAECFLPLLVAWVFWVPNTLRLLSDYSPCLNISPVEPSRWNIPVNFCSAFFIGMALILLIRDYFINQSTLFIYFKF